MRHPAPRPCRGRAQRVRLTRRAKLALSAERAANSPPVFGSRLSAGAGRKEWQGGPTGPELDSGTQGGNTCGLAGPVLLAGGGREPPARTRESNPFHAGRNPLGITWTCDRCCGKYKGSTFPARSVRCRLTPSKSMPSDNRLTTDIGTMIADVRAGGQGGRVTAPSTTIGPQS